VVVLARVRHGEHHRDLRIELGAPLLLEVVGGVEIEPVVPKAMPPSASSRIAVGAGGAATDDGPTSIRPRWLSVTGTPFAGRRAWCRAHASRRS